MANIKYKVVMVSAGGVKHDFDCDLTEDEAFDICEMNGWEFQDENGFVWGLNYERDR